MSGASGFRRRDYHEPPAPPPPQIAPAPDDDGHPTGIAPGAGPAVSVAPPRAIARTTKAVRIRVVNRSAVSTPLPEAESGRSTAKNSPAGAHISASVPRPGRGASPPQSPSRSCPQTPLACAPAAPPRRPTTAGFGPAPAPGRGENASRCADASAAKSNSPKQNPAHTATDRARMRGTRTQERKPRGAQVVKGHVRRRLGPRLERRTGGKAQHRGKQHRGEGPTAVLCRRTASLSSRRATVMRFSGPSSWACRLWNAGVACG
jgi:hypothetical protein